MITLFIFIIGLQISFLYALTGPLLTLFKSSFIIDGIGHSIVAGIAVGFLLSHSLHAPYLMLAAIGSAFCMTALNEFLQKHNISADAALGISFSLLFSIGILLISLYARNIHLDLDMILLGNIEYSLYDTITLYKNIYIPKIILFLSLGSLLFSGYIYFFYEQIKIITFDSEFSKIKGIQKNIIIYIFMALFSVFVIITFHAMGSLLLLGLAVSPFGFSWHQSKSYENFIKEGVLLSVLTGGIGVALSLYYNTSISATITASITTSSLITYFIKKNYYR